jgi:hypothetical protein
MELQCQSNGTEIEINKVTRAFEDLCLILDNWTGGYIRLLDERGVDWSTPHEFLEEFFHMMCPYIDHLHKTGNTRPDLMKELGAKFVQCMGQIIEKCDQEEYVLRLTGGWTDNEQEIKEHWQDKEGAIIRLLSV